MRPELPVLIKARAKIADEANWGKGTRINDRPRHTCCAAEAIEAVVKRSNVRMAAYDALRRAIGLGHGVTLPILEWNDAPERTHAEVLAAFDKAIEAAS